MREHKYRAFDKVTNKMIATGFHVIGEVTMFNMIDAYLQEHTLGMPTLLRLNEVVLMQYTGKQDKSGNDIYEGDIIEFDANEWGGGGNNKFIVEWDNDNSCWSFGGGLVSDMEYRTIIGNIYDNPELLT